MSLLGQIVLAALYLACDKSVVTAQLQVDLLTQQPGIHRKAPVGCRRPWGISGFCPECFHTIAAQTMVKQQKNKAYLNVAILKQQAGILSGHSEQLESPALSGLCSECTHATAVPTMVLPHKNEAYLKVAVLKQQPGVLRMGPVCSRSAPSYQGFSQNALILMPCFSLIAPLQGHFGNAPQGLLPY